MRIAAGVEYEGTHFVGWETQPGRRSVQASVEAALSRVADAPVRTVCAGRTDSGVHALGQVVHFDAPAERSTRSWVLGANANLPRDVSLVWAVRVPPDFHARFSARRRHYRYVIVNRATRPAVGRDHATWECRPLDAQSMRAAAWHLVGEHDFSAYRAFSCQARNPVRTVHRLDVSRDQDRVIIDVVANAFLHRMVRNIAGVLMAIGMGKHAPAWAGEVLAARDRTLGGVTAPAQGLYLMAVAYPDHPGLPAGSARGPSLVL